MTGGKPVEIIKIRVTNAGWKAIEGKRAYVTD